jgi:succinoglycan biosynthesis protein ExoO
VISIIVPMFNAAKTIDRAIDSVRAQTFEDWELLLVDDASTDGSRERFLAAFENDPKMKVLALPVNSGPAAARNLGLREARGEWVALLDADDAWRPGRLAFLLGQAEGADFIADNIMTYDAVAGEESGLLFPTFRAPAADLRAHLTGILAGAEINVGLLKPLMRRKFLLDRAISYDESLRFSEDYVMYCEALCQRARFKLLGADHYIYTLWMGRKSKLKSPHTHTRPTSVIVSKKMSDIFQRFAHSLSGDERAAFQSKISELRYIDTWYAFRGAVNRRNPFEGARLALSSPYVRFRVVESLRRRLGLPPRLWLHRHRAAVSDLP